MAGLNQFPMVSEQTHTPLPAFIRFATPTMLMAPNRARHRSVGFPFRCMAAVPKGAARGLTGPSPAPIACAAIAALNFSSLADRNSRLTTSRLTNASTLVDTRPLKTTNLHYISTCYLNLPSMNAQKTLSTYRRLRRLATAGRFLESPRHYGVLDGCDGFDGCYSFQKKEFYRTRVGGRRGASACMGHTTGMKRGKAVEAVEGVGCIATTAT